MTARSPKRPAAARAAAVAGVAVTALAGCGGSGAPAATKATTPSVATTAPPPASLTATVAPFSLPQAESRMAVVVHGNAVDLLGGLASGDVSTSRVVHVDLAAASAANAGRLQVAVHDTAGGPVGGGDLVFGGGASTERSDVQRFTPGASAGTTASGVGSATGATTTIGHLPTARSDSAAATIGSTTYLIGGFDGSSLSTAVLATTDGTDLHQVGTLGQGVRYPAVAALDGKIYVMGGDTGTAEGATGPVDLVQRFDPAAGTSSVVGHLPQAVGHAMGAALDGRLWLIGGSSGSAPSSAIFRIDPSSGAVAPAGTLPDARSDAGVAVVGGNVWLFGGEHSSTSHPLSSIVELTPA